MSNTVYDLISIGRSSLDLFSQDIGAPFTQITGFTTQVGGSPTNIAIGSSRLGLRSAVLTAVGQDPVGDFVLAYLEKEKVDTTIIPRKDMGKTSLAVVGVQPPDKFPLTFYRENPPDIHLTIEDVPVDAICQSKAFLVSGTALSRGSCRDATLYASEVAKENGIPVFIDLDLRANQWSHPRAYGVNMRRLLPLLDVIIGTEEEVLAAFDPNPEAVMAGEELSAEYKARALQHAAELVEQVNGPRAVLVKRGPLGVTVFTRGAEAKTVSGFSVEVVNTVGAGDAFASGVLYGFVQGWSLSEAARFGNACGAIVVSRHGCAAAMPYVDEVNSLIEAQS